tara:strand:- start:34256 stop:35263 length:1008 start_codon:yes stop_codon:yes gene_type:complete
MNHSGYLKPPQLQNSAGEERTVGYEFEFTGIEIEQVAQLVNNLYGGKIEKISTYEIEVQESEFGTFKMELDAQLLRDKKYEKILKSVGIDVDDIKDKGGKERKLMEMAATIVPYEIVTPPIPLSKMDVLDRLVDKLREKKIKGTGSSILYAFGMHINPEVPDVRVESILNHTRAYVLMDPWIRREADINMSRRITPFIDPYSEKYVKLILNPEYTPDLKTMIKDYFDHDNSRNRSLDLLPLFMHLDERTTSSMIDEELTSARPTYHYRLPDCSFEKKEWSPALEWNRWVLVERIADDEEQLAQLSHKWLELSDNSMIGFESKWIKKVDDWVNSNG